MRVPALPAVLVGIVLAAAGCASPPAADDALRLGPGERIEVDVPARDGGLHLRNRGPAPVECVLRLRGGRVLAEAVLGELHLPDLSRFGREGEMILVLASSGPGGAAVEIAVTGDAERPVFGLVKE